MLKKSLFLGLMLLCLSSTSMAQMGGMSDKQVLEYVQTGLKQGKTQKQIAEFLNMQTTVYRRYECGERELPLWAAIKLAKYYNVTLDYLVEE